jgi:hypothetical protein
MMAYMLAMSFYTAWPEAADLAYLLQRPLMRGEPDSICST